MKNLLKKVRGDKKGFTLAELLVVVAIIGILVAISIPIFTAQLGKARKATNEANLRAAKAAAVAAYLTDEDRTTTDDKAKESKTYGYSITDGTIVTAYTGLKTDESDVIKDITADATDKYTYKKINVTLTADATVTNVTVSFTTD